MRYVLFAFLRTENDIFSKNTSSKNDFKKHGKSFLLKMFVFLKPFYSRKRE